MRVLLTGGTDSYAQFITVLLLFVLVLGITALTTRWIANYQKQAGTNENIQVIETARIANNKFVQIIRTGEKYFVVAVCKDTVTMLGEIPEEQLKTGDPPQGFRFRELFDKTVKRQAEDRSGPKGSRVDE
ncbi:MAG: flagellar biosynthetic protein FliO [Acetatifactor sp.]|nr:flagellar biosynthetic protein FliO [Acetatifactor sp.]MDE7353765.1 flagellar biosynthetic protein FliO [Acetatifactor sp.]